MACSGLFGSLYELWSQCGENRNLQKFTCAALQTADDRSADSGQETDLLKSKDGSWISRKDLANLATHPDHLVEP